MNGKNVVVTGAAGGLGSAISLTLAKAGAGIAVLDVNPDGARALAEKIRALGGNAVPIVGDLTTREGAHGLFAEAVRAFGHIDGLVNNAGIYPRRPIFEITDEEWNASLGVNVRGLYHMTVAAVEHMRPRREGRIVNIASIDAFKAHPKNSHYAATKAAVVSLTKTFGLEVAPLGILVNAVAPGPIATETAKKMGFLPSIEAETPIGRAAEPEDIAEVILFLISDRNRYMVGETVVAAGGYYIP
ncbi:SDR family NAD(P)-dependent oxidoreductase [Labrys wisconsinensis]|uniref:NAD(P)-dependent dehydrogenase (Short-subunit alcohol dehydrogenase family) n=1 Tax=Labrys wisconsinensis TaxID=425677 RepID=A0ABU0JCU6_9HYPH|nr:SDR family NAD(P)-dependent oxidoreductase [Labrys wisconsinensis]MDQ0472107.1 NAD(P)-dependent dehydrogenase (short-subunit alcohol dehydrogenase family) [Labrys wisconsinensis]